MCAYANLYQFAGHGLKYTNSLTAIEDMCYLLIVSFANSFGPDEARLKRRA